MFEWEAKDLQTGDEFTIDHGETWHTVLQVKRMISMRKIFVADTPFELVMPGTKKVIVR